MAQDGAAAEDLRTGGSDASNLKHRSISAVLWGTVGAFMRIGLQIVAQIVLARILGPEQFGLFAMGLVVIFFSSFFADVGLAYGLIQRKVVSDEDIRFVFTWQMVLGLLITVVLFVAAPAIARFYDDQRLVDVVQWLSLTCVIGALGSAASTLLRRELDFKTLNLAAAISYAVGFLVVGIPMALLGFGVESLIAAFLTQMFIQALICFLKRRHPVRPLFWQPAAMELIRFGGTVFATNLVNWVMNSVDRLVVGRTMSMTSAGLYSTVHNFISAPTIQALSLLQSVLYSASARVQDSTEKLQSGLRTMSGIVGLAVMPVFFTVAVVAPTFMHAVYGHKWVGGEVVLAPLAVAMPALLLMGMATPILWTSGNTTKEFRIQIPIAIVWLVVLVAVSHLGSLALLSWAVCGLFYLRAGVIVQATLNAIGMRPIEWLSLLRPGLVVSAGVMLAAWLTDHGLASVVPIDLLRLLIVVAVSGVAFVAMLRAVRGLLSGEVLELFVRLSDRVPAGKGRRVVALLFA
ncbi:MAG: lipopolysaccharide biosynthesis protein [Lautropia sp.]